MHSMMVRDRQTVTDQHAYIYVDVYTHVDDKMTICHIVVQ